MPRGLRRGRFYRTGKSRPVIPHGRQPRRPRGRGPSAQQGATTHSRERTESRRSAPTRAGPALGAQRVAPGGVAPPSATTPESLLAAPDFGRDPAPIGVGFHVAGPARGADDGATDRASVPESALAPHATPGRKANWRQSNGGASMINRLGTPRGWRHSGVRDEHVLAIGRTVPEFVTTIVGSPGHEEYPLRQSWTASGFRVCRVVENPTTRRC